MNRSIGVTVIAVLSMLGSFLTFAMGMLMVVIAVFVPDKAPSMPPALMKGILILASAMYVLPAIWGFCTSIGLFRLRNWARISMIVFSVLLILMSAFAGLMAIVMIFIPMGGPAANGPGLIVARMVMAFFWLVQLGIGIWWLIFFTRAKVKAQFVPAVVVSPQIEYQVPAMAVRPVSAMKSSGRPVSITVIACLLLAGCFFIPASLIMRTPAIFFTKVFFGWSAALVFLTFTAIQLYVGIGLLRLQPVARLVALAYFAFGAANTAVFFLVPGAGTRMSALLEWQKSTFFGQLSALQPQFNLDFAPLFRMSVILGALVGIAGIAVQMYFLITRKAAFDKAISGNAVI